MCLHVTLTQRACVGHLLCDRENTGDTNGDLSTTSGTHFQFREVTVTAKAMLIAYAYVTVTGSVLSIYIY